MEKKVAYAKKKLDKAVTKRSQIERKIPKKQKQRLYEKQKQNSGLKFAEDMPKPSEKLLDKPKGISGLERTIQKTPQDIWKASIHQEVSKNEDDNVGVETVHKIEQTMEVVGDGAINKYRQQRAKPYVQLQKAEDKVEKASVNYSYQKKMAEESNIGSNPISRFQQKRAIKQQYASAFRQGNQTTAEMFKSTVQQGTSVVTNIVTKVSKNPKTWLWIGCLGLLLSMIGIGFSACSSMFTGSVFQTVSSSYPSENEDILNVDAQYMQMEADLEQRIDDIPETHPDYDEYRYSLDSINHNSHDLAAYLTAIELYYLSGEVDDELNEIFGEQYTLTITSEVEIRYRTETRRGSYTDSEGNSHSYTYTVEVPYEYYILNVELENIGIDEAARNLLTAEELEMYEVYQETQGNKPFLFGGGSTNSSPSTDLSGADFVDGERVGNQEIVNIAMGEVGNVGGEPYWSWYGFDSRVEWCATFVSWVLNQAGYSEPKFASCQNQGVPYFVSNGQWAGSGYDDIAAGDVIFFDWDGNGTADHVGIVIGTDGDRVYTVEGNSGDACMIRDYDLNSSVIMGYGLMN